MKLCIASVLCLQAAGCDFPVSEGTPSSVSNAVKVADFTVPNQHGIFVIVIDGHEYLVLSGFRKAGICHKADCKACSR